jgi:hypothetical protein
MKKYLIILLLTFGSINVKAQSSCEEIMQFVKSKDNGTTYTSYNSDAISKVTFYSIYVDYKTLYFAIVCFKKEYSYSCNEYIYQVGSDTKFNYSYDYYNSAGKAFWKYIQPYSKNLGCGPNLE